MPCVAFSSAILLQSSSEIFSINSSSELKEKRAEEKQQEKKDLTVKRTTIQANSEEELIEKISELDWSKIAEEKATQGMKFDTTI